MRSHRLLIILLASISAIVIAAFVLTITNDDSPRDIPADPGSTIAPTERTFPDLPPTTAPLPPTTDLFGNRLEVPHDESGVALPQDPSTRPEPTRPDYLITPPAWMQWQRGWGGAALPVSGSDGPARIHYGIATGFAHTPQGAALAAADALARALAAPEGVWQEAVRERYYGGGQALLDRFSRSRKRTRDAARYVVVPDGVRIQPGYRDDLAVVQFAAHDNIGYTISAWPMAWIDGDWRVRVPDNVEILWGPGASTSSLAGFGVWKGMS
ncbi:hypothetical protein OHB12_12170 [Nocardia sp. NBC_01730]|uniref:hypothetical protein n=1 Tax=Nocardia sp. NBC_01730 TaxID=2975998 RepID=UPI002E0F0D77|nr:hypothetical protein OHB12_12170 [Nocardia sp. NBC_01730]